MHELASIYCCSVLQSLFTILAIFYCADPKKIINSARTMSPALQFHNDGGPPYMLQMVCPTCFLEFRHSLNLKHCYFYSYFNIWININFFN